MSDEEKADGILAVLRKEMLAAVKSGGKWDATMHVHPLPPAECQGGIRVVITIDPKKREYQ